MMELLKGRAVVLEDNSDDKETEQVLKKMPKKRGKAAKKVVDSDESKGGEGEGTIETAGLEAKAVEKVSVPSDTFKDGKETADVASIANCPEDHTMSTEGNPVDNSMDLGLVDYSSDNGLFQQRRLATLSWLSATTYQ
jgi:hypothetical protein